MIFPGAVHRVKQDALRRPFFRRRQATRVIRPKDTLTSESLLSIKKYYTCVCSYVCMYVCMYRGLSILRRNDGVSMQPGPRTLTRSRVSRYGRGPVFIDSNDGKSEEDLPGDRSDAQGFDCTVNRPTSAPERPFFRRRTDSVVSVFRTLKRKKGLLAGDAFGFYSTVFPIYSFLPNALQCNCSF